MSFFGITALGSQNPFQSSLIDAIGLKVFTREEFKSSFEKLDKDRSGYIDMSEVRDLLRETYGMEPLQIEIDMFMSEFDENHDGRISWQEFENTLTNIVRNLEAKAKRAADAKSYEDLTYKRRKHIRNDIKPHDVYKKPLTYGQGYGFFEYQEVRKLPVATENNFNRTRCAETKYADDLIAGGHHFS